MPIESTAFWSGVLGASLPGIAVGLLTWVLTTRSQRALARLQAELARDNEALRLWQSRRVDAYLSVYEAFRKYLDFLRRYFYLGPDGGRDVTTMHDFRSEIEKQLVLLDEPLSSSIISLEAELHEFWNWAIEHYSSEAGLALVQQRLDGEIPDLLNRLRALISNDATHGVVANESLQLASARIVPPTSLAPAVRARS